MSELLHFSSHTLQEVALGIMALVYTIRLIWLFKRFKGGKERQPTTGKPGENTKAKGVIFSWAVIAMPWSMESQRRNLLFYLQFVVFHLGVVSAIALSFYIPYWPSLLDLGWAVMGLQISIGAACVVGVIRIFRRIFSKYIRAISTPDDYFCLLLLTAWFAFAFLAAPNDYSRYEWHLITYFILTAFFLIYVPFSKISHYLYYPFTRYWLGKTMAHRGVYPMKDGHSVRA